MKVLEMNRMTEFNRDKVVVAHRGNDNFFVNVYRNFCAIPHKIFLWNSRNSSGWVSDETISKVARYLIENGLEDVEISVNEYAPFRNASRCFTNPHTSILTKLMYGTLNSIRHFLPLKLFMPYDYYNPISNTLVIYSDDGNLALAEAARAKSYRNFNAPGLFTFGTWIPILGTHLLLHQSLEVLDSASKFVKQTEGEEAYQNGYRSIMARSFLDSCPIGSQLIFMGLVHLFATAPKTIEFRAKQIPLDYYETEREPKKRPFTQPVLVGI